MKIKSNFKDYYDFTLAGIVAPDQNIVYARNLEIKKYTGPNLGNNNYFFTKNNSDGIFKSKFYVYFCGKLYKGLQEVYYIKEDNGSIELANARYSYDQSFEDNSEMFDLMKNIANGSPIVTLKEFSNVMEFTPERNIGWDKKNKYKDDLFKQENKHTVITDKMVYGPKFVINDSLKNVSFSNIKSDCLVYQELEMFLANINSQEKDVEFTDKDKIIQHGFDKYSFKKSKK